MLYTLKKADDEAMAAIQEEKNIRNTKEIFLLFSLGSQFDHLIKQEIEKLGVFCLVADPASVTAKDVERVNPTGIILSGGPVSVYEEPPPFDGQIFDIDVPILGICLGFQLWAQHAGVEVVLGKKREFSTHNVVLKNHVSSLFHKCPKEMSALMSHGDIIMANGKINVLASTENAPVAAAQYGNLWGVQFHPEVTETEYGQQIFKNFIFGICGAKDRFPAKNVAMRKIAEIEEKIVGKKVLLALSGGSDSSTVAYLLKYARTSNTQIRAVYIKAVDRPDDEAFVRMYFANEPWLELVVVDATERFLEALKGKVTMPEKRMSMRGIYKAVLEEEAKKFAEKDVIELEVLIAQGTLYTDISESGGGYASGAKKAKIKMHHNVNLGFSYEELLPLSDCVKDSGRNIGREIGVPEELLTRHPFPGPGMIVRIEGEINREKLEISRQSDDIYIEELRKWDLYNSVWQAGAVVTQSFTTCTKGDDAVSGMIIALWAVWSVNGFTARSAELPYEFLKVVSRRITNEIRSVGGVVYRISDKPPTTIEWG